MEKENLNKDINLDEKQEAENNDKKDAIPMKTRNYDKNEARVGQRTVLYILDNTTSIDTTSYWYEFVGILQDLKEAGIFWT